MTAVQIVDDMILLDGGAIALDPNCCCDGEPCTPIEYLTGPCAWGDPLAPVVVPSIFIEITDSEYVSNPDCEATCDQMIGTWEVDCGDTLSFLSLDADCLNPATPLFQVTNHGIDSLTHDWRVSVYSFARDLLYTLPATLDDGDRYYDCHDGDLGPVPDVILTLPTGAFSLTFATGTENRCNVTIASVST